jgi:hypothetical protein
MAGIPMRGLKELESEAGARVYLDLRRIAKANARNTEAVVQRFVLERVVSRIFAGPSADRFALKGGMILMQAEGVGPILGRATTDIDLHVPYQGPLDDMRDILVDALSAPVETDDGVRFDLPSLRIAHTRDGTVAGASMSVTAQVGQVGVKVRCDLGFDSRPVFDVAVSEGMDSVVPERFGPVLVRRVPFSWTLADKVQCLVRHGEATTRLRDYYDMHLLLTRGLADPDQAAEALVGTFALFGNELPATVDDIGALSEGFATRNAGTWDREIRRRGFAVPMPPFPEACAFIRESLAPILESAHDLSSSPPTPF